MVYVVLKDATNVPATITQLLKALTVVAPLRGAVPQLPMSACAQDTRDYRLVEVLCLLV